MSDDSKFKDPLDDILSADLAPLPVGPGGDFIPGIGNYEQEPLPPATPEHFVCLRGPCKHYMELRQNFPVGNSAGTLERLPVQISRSCLRLVGVEIELTDTTVRDCNQWDPTDDVLVQLRRTNREKFTKEFGHTWDM